MAEKLTPWFPSSTVPSRPGVYISTVVEGFTFYRRWDGRQWHYGHATDPERAAAMDRPWHLCGLHWRGLAKEPKRA